MREMLTKLRLPEIAALPERELQRLILICMLEREQARPGGMLDVTRPGGEIIDATIHENFDYQQRRDFAERIERNFRRAIAALEQQRLIEPASGNPSHRVLTPEGRQAAKDPIDLEAVRIRGLLKREMLHAKLRDKPYRDFANGDPTSAISEAFKILEIEVREAAKQSAGISGQRLMQIAFEASNGPLTDKSEVESVRKAQPILFGGAMGRFRNESTHNHRTFPDLHEAIEELMVASRLLRFLDEPGRPRKS